MNSLNNIIPIITASLTLLIDLCIYLIPRIMRLSQKKKRTDRGMTRYKIVLKDKENERIYAFLKEGANTKRLTLDINERTITCSDALEEMILKEVRLANSAELFAFNYALSKIENDIENPYKTIVTEEDDLIMELLGKKAKENMITYSALVVALIIELAFSVLHVHAVSNWIFFFICSLIILCFVNQCVLKYRVKKGLYGTCSFEAKEIISYILNKQTRNRTGGNMPRLVFLKEEMDQRVLQKQTRGEMNAQQL